MLIEYFYHYMNKVCFLVCCLLIFNCLSAQTQINTLLLNLQQANGDSEKTEIYKGIILHYSTTDPDSENWYLNAGIQYANAHHYPLGAAKVLAQAAVADQNHGRVDVGEQRTHEALKRYRELHYLAGVAEMTHNLGTIEASKGNFDIANKYFISALRVYDSVTDNHGLLLTYMNLGELYLQQADTLNAWKNLMYADSLSRKTPLSDATIYLNDNIGAYLAESGRKDTALKIFLNNFKLSDRPALVNSHIECLLYLSDYYSDKGDFAAALKYLNEGVEIAKNNHLLEMEANFLVDIAHLNEKTNIKLAIADLDSAKVICQQIHSKSFLVLVYTELDTAYILQGDYKSALAATVQKQILMDSIFSVEKSKEIEKIDAAYALEKNKKIKELEDLNQQNTFKRNALIGASGVLFVLVFVLLFYYRKTAVLNRKLTLHEKELQELNSMKDKLFSIIGHDLRSPLTQIPAILDIYMDTETSEEERRFMFESLREHSNASLETLDKLLLWGKSLVKGIGLKMTKFATKKLIRQNIELKKTAAVEKKITVYDHTPDDLMVYCDVTHFDFVIRNLLTNAIKFTHQNGAVFINSYADRMQGFIVFEVRDTGIGIEKELLKTIFSPLNSRTGTANEKGAGIGLMLCKEFIMKNDGNIWAESEDGKGSSFFFSVKCDA